MSVSEDQLSGWTSRAFNNEEQRADDTERAIRNAIENHSTLAGMDIRILPKGSIKNNTNVRRDSDIDIAVINRQHIITQYEAGVAMGDVGLEPYSGISAQEFKSLVGDAIRAEFGNQNIDASGNRVFKIRGSTTVMDADVIPSTLYWYVGRGSTREGIALILDVPDGNIHFNYPDQHFDNGVAKNNRTGRRYKRVVRILKNIENKLVADGILQDVPSFLIECLAYNVPDTIYNAGHSTWRSLITSVCENIWAYVSSEEPADEYRWTEVNGFKFLFSPSQRWTKQQAAAFISSVYDMVAQ